MSLQFDFELTAPERARILAIAPTAWFTHVSFKNTVPAIHPESDRYRLDQNHVLKRSLVLSWIENNVKGKRVLDLFCANGAFSFEAAMAGAKEVVGVDFSEERVACAQILADIVRTKASWCTPKFLVGNVYKLTQTFAEPFDVVMCLGGLYHIADPPHVLDQICALTRERVILQTSQIIRGRGSWGEFKIPKEDPAKGVTSIVGGRGAWHPTVECFENMVRHAGLTILESCRPSLMKRRGFPWYCCLAKPT